MGTYNFAFAILNVVSPPISDITQFLFQYNLKLKFTLKLKINLKFTINPWNF